MTPKARAGHVGHGKHDKIFIAKVGRSFGEKKTPRGKCTQRQYNKYSLDTVPQLSIFDVLRLNRRMREGIFIEPFAFKVSSPAYSYLTLSLARSLSS